MKPTPATTRAARGLSTQERLVLVALMLTLWIGGVGARLVHLQVYNHEWLEARAVRQQERTVEVSPRRGRILDREGRELARSIERQSVYATLSEVKDPAATARRLAPILGVPERTLLDRLTCERTFVCLKRKVDPEVHEAVAALGIEGVEFVPEMKRVYPNHELASHVLGYCGVDENGLAGLELAFDRQVRGTEGRVVLATDARRRSYDVEGLAPTPGNDLQLTIDEVAQYRVEKALAEGVRQTGAKWGVAVVMSPKTGEVIALANYPTFNPNEFGKAKDEARRNRAVEETFEPGSVFKIVPYSGCVEERLITPDTRVDCQYGSITVAGRVVHDGAYGVLRASDAFAVSSNVAAIKMGMKLGNERLYDYVKRFGFGRRTGIELPAESAGLVAPVEKWGPTTIGSIPMGHEIGVTAVQDVAAMAALANGGLWVQPHLVRRVISPTGATVSDTVPRTQRAVSEQTAATMRGMLEAVVVKGTAQKAGLDTIRAAGKTGTAQKIDPRSGRYSHSKYLSSFCGFAPAEAPELACVVVLDEPGGARVGGATAAPIFGRIMQDLFAGYSIPGGVEAPQVAPNQIAASGARRTELASVAPVEGTSPAAAERSGNPRPGLDVLEATYSEGSVVVPDLGGLGLRAAIQKGAEYGLTVEASGSGRVGRQSLPPGAVVAPGAKVAVELSP